MFDVYRAPRTIWLSKAARVYLLIPVSLLYCCLVFFHISRLYTVLVVILHA